MKDKEKSFFQRYKCWFIILTLTLIVAYVIAYLCFYGNGFISTGTDLDKSDWLSFLGSYLAFSGTVFVSLTAMLQSHYYAEQGRQKEQNERRKNIQPIFSVNIEKIDSQVSGTAEPFSLSDPSTYPRHKNVTISIENVGTHPIRNVIVFDKYLCQLLKPGEKKGLQIAYSDSPDMKKWGKRLISILESDFERSDDGIPKWFNINYDDVDANEMYQIFRLKEFDGTMYYSLEGTHQI